MSSLFRFIPSFAVLLFSLMLSKAYGSNTQYITQDTTWSGTVQLTGEVYVKAGKKLTVNPGTLILLDPGISITSDSACELNFLGSASQPVRLLPAQEGKYWGAIKARLNNTSLIMNHVEIIGGRVEAVSGCYASINDCYFHDYNNGDRAILLTRDADSIDVHRLHVSNYYEINLIRTPALVEDCLFEYMTADGIDFDNAPLGSVLRNSTIRFGIGINIDAIDLGKLDFQPPGSQVRVENCLVHDITDKGVSVGEGCILGDVTGCVFFRCGAGVAVKDSSIALIHNNTFYDCDIAVELVEKNEGLGGGHGTAWNNIHWHNQVNDFYLTSDATISASYSLIEGITSDTSNHLFSSDPVFVDPLNEDFHLSPGSPAIGAGLSGMDLGALFPVGNITGITNELRIGHPQAGMILRGDSSMNITWTSPASLQFIDLQLSTDGKTTWQPLITYLPASDGKWTWQIPNVYTTRGFLRITDHSDTSVCYTNYLPFSIIPSGDTTQVPVFTIPAGFYNTPLDVSILAPPGSIVYYTLDGSDPSDHSSIYSGPVHLEHEEIPLPQQEQKITESSPAHAPYAFVRTAPVSMIGIPHTFWVPPTSPISKAAVLRARLYTPGSGLGKIVTSSYFIDSNIVDRFPLPVISLATDPYNLFDYFSGIYIPGATFTGYAFTGNYEMSGRASERFTHFEFFESNGTPRLSLNTGIRTRGEWIRNLGQKALTVYARQEYDETNEFHYAFFPGLKKPGTSTYQTKFKRIILRNNGNNWGGENNTMCTDGIIQSLFDHLDLKYQAYRPSLVYLNGEYWGIHNIRELNDERGIEFSYGVDPDSVILMEDNLDTTAHLIAGFPGDELSYLELIDRIANATWTDSSEYNWIDDHMDISNFIDYWCATIYSNKLNTDHNQSYWRLRNGQPGNDVREGRDGKWRWLAADFDGGFDSAQFNNLEFMLYEVKDSLLFHLLRNDRFKTDFITRFADLLNSSFESNRVLQRIDSIESLLAPAMPEHIGRWGTPYNLNAWEIGMDKLKRFANERPEHQRDHLQSHFFLSGKQLLTVNVDDRSHGIIKVNTLQVDQNLPGVTDSVYPWNGIYFKDISVQLTARSNPGYRFIRWETKVNDSTVVLSGDSSVFIDLLSDSSLTAIFEKVESISPVVSGFTVYPNPLTGNVLNFGTFRKVKVFDLTGKIVLPEITTMHLDVSSLSSGSYIIRDENGEQARFVITRE